MDKDFSFLHYFDLPEEERETLLKSLRSDDALREIVEEAGILKSFIAHLHEESDSSDPVGMVIELILARHFGLQHLPEWQRARIERIQRRVDADPQLTRQAGRIQSRVEELLMSVDRVRHFEQLSGHKLHDPPPDVRPVQRDQAKQANRRVLLRNVNPALPLGFAAVLIPLLLYALLSLISVQTTPYLVRLAPEINMDDYIVAGPLRGEPVAAPQVAARLHAAAALVDESTSATLGLFPRVDSGRLDESRQLLRQIIAETEVDSFFATEAYYLMGVAGLLDQNEQEARQYLEMVIQHGGRMTMEARRLLERIGEPG